MIPGKLDTAALAALAPPRDPEPRPTGTLPSGCWPNEEGVCP